MSDRYDVNFFKPKGGYATANARIVFALLVIWVVAIFGFHFLMRAIEKPVPEQALVQFEAAWPKYVAGKASQGEMQGLAKGYLTVLGKQIALRSNKQFKAAFTKLAYDLLPEARKAGFAAEAKGIVESGKLTGDLAAVLGVDKDPLLSRVIPFALAPFDGSAPAARLDDIPAVFTQNLTHYRSFLTDMVFFGFPFHYFYTGLFLPGLFIAMCLYYCLTIQKINVRYGMETEE